jgi:hypothetical protein
VNGGPDAPIRSLGAFDRVHFEVGEQKEVRLNIPAKQFGDAREIEITVGSLTKRVNLVQVSH